MSRASQVKALNHNLALRLGTAALGLPVVVLLAWAGGLVWAVAAGLVILLASIEFWHGWLFPSMPLSETARRPISALGPLVMVIGAHWDARFVGAGAAFALIYVVLGWGQSRIGPRKPYRVQAGMLVYLGVLGSTAVLLRDGPDGRDWLFIALLSTFAVDTGAYAVGRAIGRHKLAPRISPKKTVEGAIGGYILGTAALVALEAIFDTRLSVTEVLPLAILFPAAAEAGDLAESFMKRRMGVKDASGLLPGHGGFLDRLDSVLFVLPLTWAWVELVG